jgi:glycosyltransferase involved in cell wall biosynthesis
MKCVDDVSSVITERAYVDSVLMAAPLPPPVTGHSLASKVLMEGLVSEGTHVSAVNLSKPQLASGRFHFGTFFRVLKDIFSIAGQSHRFEIIYLTISESFLGNIKDLLIYLVCLFRLKSVCVHLHGGTIKESIFDRSKSLRMVNGYFLRRVGAVVVLGESLKGIFLELGVSANRIHVVPNFVEDSMMLAASDKKDKKFDSETLQIYYMSHMIKEKGYLDLLTAYNLLSGRVKERIRIDFAGSFDSEIEKKSLLSKIDGMPGVFYHGVVAGAAKSALLKSSHAFCLPTYFSEGQPISIIEAYANACVVLTVVSGGIRDIFEDGVNGFSIRKGSPDSIASAIEKITQDPHGMSLIAQHNYECATIKFRQSAYIANMIDVFSSMLRPAQLIEGRNDVI